MVRKIQTFQLEDGSSIAVEVEAAPGEEERIANTQGEVVEQTNKTFGAALKTVQQAMAEVLEGFSKTLDPNELELNFGLKFSAKAGVVLASTDAEATLTLRAKWKKAL